MHNSFTSLRAGCPAPVALRRLLLTLGLIAGLLGIGSTRAEIQQIPPSDDGPVTFSFTGSDAGSGRRVTGWVTFIRGIGGTFDTETGKAIYNIPRVGLNQLTLVITDESSGSVLFVDHSTDILQLRIECTNAATTSTFRIIGRGNVLFDFTVQGPLGSLFSGVQLPGVAPGGTAGSWTVLVPSSGDSWGGNEFSYTSGEETAALLALLDAANAQVASLTTDLETAQGELRTLRLDYKIATVALTKADAQIEQLTSDLAAAQAQITQLTSERDAAGGELKLLKRDYRIATNQLRYAEAVAERLTADLATANGQVTLLGTQLETARLELSTARLQVLQLQTDLAASKALNEELQGQLDSQSSTLAGIGATLGASGKDPSFKVPGATVEEQLANLAAAIQRLNPGQQKALHGELGGPKK